MRVTAVTGNTLTVDRNISGGTLGTFVAGDEVFLLVRILANCHEVIAGQEVYKRTCIRAAQEATQFQERN